MLAKGVVGALALLPHVLLVVALHDLCEGAFFLADDGGSRQSWVRETPKFFASKNRRLRLRCKIAAANDSPTRSSESCQTAWLRTTG